MLLNKIPKIIDDELFAKILSLQSICYFNLGKSDKALFHTNASIGINPANSNYYKIKSTILNHLNLIEQSILCEKKAIEVDDENKRKDIINRLKILSSLILRTPFCKGIHFFNNFVDY